MKTGNEAAMDSLRPTFKGRFTSFSKKIWSLTRDPEGADALSAKIADWNSKLLAGTFASAIQIATSSLQIQCKLPLSFHLLSLSLLLGFTSLLVPKLVEFKSLWCSQILHCLGLFFLVFAFYVAISIPFPLYFELISYTVFLTVSTIIFYFTIIHKTDSHSLPISNQTE